MRRRDFVTRIGMTIVLALGVSLLAIPTSLKAQKAAGIKRVGWLEVCGPGPRAPTFRYFPGSPGGTRLRGGEEPHHRAAICRLPIRPDAGVGHRLVQVPVDVIFTMGTRAARIVAETVKTTPLVVYSCDPFLHVKSLARPGGNLTGVTCMTTEMMPKRLELLHEAVPKVSRVMFLHDPEAAPNAFKLTQEAAPRLGITMQAAQVTAAEELLPELAMIAKEHPDALLVYPDVVLSSASPASAARRLRHQGQACPRCMRSVFSSTLAVSCPMARPHPRSIRPRPSRLQRSWVALGRVSCRCDRQRGLSWSSTTGRRRRSDSQSHRRCWSAPTR